MNPQFYRYYTYIRPLVKNKTVKTYSPLVFSIIMITIFSIFAIKPTLSTIVSLQKSIKEQQNLLDKATSKSDALSLGRKNYEELDEEIRLTLLRLLPNSTSLPNLVSILTALSNKYEASMSGLQIQPVILEGLPTKLVKNAKLQEISFSFTAQGNYDELMNLLDSLYRVNRLIKIDAVTFSKAEDSGVLNLIVSARAYYVKN